MIQLGKTPSQTIGPFFRFGTEWLAEEDVVARDYPGSIVLKGTIYDGAGSPLPDAMIEILHADETGAFSSDTSASFRGFARRLTDDSGNYAIRTVKPGKVRSPRGDLQAPHIAVVVFARGLLKPVFTRIYFPNEPGNESDQVLSAIEDDSARATLVAQRDADGAYRFDVRLQDSPKGPETQFFVFAS